MGTVFLKLLAGAAAGLITTGIMETMRPDMFSPAWTGWEQKVFLLFGCLLGALVGGLDGLTRGGSVWIWRGIGLGALLGAVGSTLGAQIGGSLANAIFGTTWTTAGALPIQIMARSMVFVGIGVLVGAAIGGSSLNLKKAVQGAVGGLVGGAIGGVLFDIVGSIIGPMILASTGQSHGEVGTVPRVIGFTLVGAMVAMMIGLVDRIARKAWLRQDLGRNEGKEWALDAPQNFIGSGEGCHVYLRGDPQVARVHASIARQGSQWVIADAGSGFGTFVNGHPIQQAALRAGDVVQIGQSALRFMEKGQAVAYQPGGFAPAAPMPQQGPYQPQGRMVPGPMGSPGPVMGGPMTPTGQPTVAFPAAAPTGQPTVAFQGQAAGPTLVAMDGPLAGRRFPVGMGLEIGREATGIALTGDPNASRRHASVVIGPSGLMVNDLGSTNGTFVDGQRVQSAPLRPGSMVRVGSTTFRIE